MEHDSLKHIQTIKTPAYPLDAVVFQKDGNQQVLVVGVDSENGNRSLVAYEQDAGSSAWNAEPTCPFNCTDAEAGSGPEVSREELDKLLYTVENLRKTDMDEAGEDDGGVPTLAQAADPDAMAPVVEAAA